VREEQDKKIGGGLRVSALTGQIWGGEGAASELKKGADAAKGEKEKGQRRGRGSPLIGAGVGAKGREGGQPREPGA